MLIDEIKKFTNQKIVIYGLGVENRQFLEWAIKIMHLSPKLFILADQQNIALDKLEKLKFFDSAMGFDKSQMYFGKSYNDALKIDAVEYVIKAPGIWSLNDKLENFRKSKGSDKVISSLHFFIEQFQNNIIGVTGTKGKTTTAGLIAHTLNNIDGYTAIYCGNSTNISPYKVWDEPVKKFDSNTYFVIELSSFQLQDLGFSHLSPGVAVITNYFIDHLDQHSDKDEYWHAKDNIYLHQIERKLFTGSHLPGYVKEQATLSITENISDNIASIVSSPLLGAHNKGNVALALTTLGLTLDKSVTQFIGSHLEEINTALNTFKNLPYRLEITSTQKDFVQVNQTKTPLTIRFINDGAATEPEAVLAAIEATTSQKNEFLWIQFTGKDKGVDIEPVIDSLLRTQTNNQLYRVDYCGEIGKKILHTTYQKMNLDIGVDLENFKQTCKAAFTSKDEIVYKFELWLQENYDNLINIGSQEQAIELINHQELILNIVLSPCGSSFDEFTNYIERSEFWNDLVAKL